MIEIRFSCVNKLVHNLIGFVVVVVVIIISNVCLCVSLDICEKFEIKMSWFEFQLSDIKCLTKSTRQSNYMPIEQSFAAKYL